MKMDVTAPPSAALEMRHDGLAEQRQALTQQLDDDELQWWRQAQERLAQHPDANTAALLSSQCKRHLQEHALPDSAGWSHIQLARRCCWLRSWSNTPPTGNCLFCASCFCGATIRKNRHLESPRLAR